MAAVGAGRSPEAAGEELAPDARRVEGLQLSLRTRTGVPLEALDGDDLAGLVEQTGDRWVLTRRGRLLANEVALRLHELNPRTNLGADVPDFENVRAQTAF